MTIIGKLNATETGFSGSINSLTVKANLVIEKIERKSSENAPDYKIISEAGHEVGAGWARVSQETGFKYILVKIDDFILPEPLFARLVKSGQDESYTLYWDRSRSKS